MILLGGYSVINEALVIADGVDVLSDAVCDDGGAGFINIVIYSRRESQGRKGACDKKCRLL